MTGSTRRRGRKKLEVFSWWTSGGEAAALGVGDSGIWASALLFENTLLGVVGPQGWTDLFDHKMHTFTTNGR
jgi:hypothetical protein